ncbi:MAG TPA: amidophosphoribosyltransferase [Acidimicrobiia bacterium]|nr:amidophosphoribosyltransferase [Acidimicrobiia bacterium]
MAETAIAIERPGEACGVFGMYGPGQDPARLTYFGLFALQHRGQESAGIAVAHDESITVVKDLGLVAQVFDEQTLASLEGDIAVGHTRYSTTGSSVWENAQPIYRQVGENGIALAHNGNLTNTRLLAEQIGKLFATTDSELMAEALASAMRQGLTLEKAALETLPLFEGAFSLAIMDRESLLAVRDPHGFRPLCLGRLNGGFVVASETAALDIIGAEFERQVAPGEMIVIDGDGLRSHRPFAPAPPRLCIFEFVYFARPDSILDGHNVHAARRRMGYRLAEQAPAAADVVVPVPESGIPAAQGFAAATGLPLADGLIKNRYVGRTFIQPAQAMRDQGIRMKLNPIPEELDARRVVLVDDSIVRGSTTRRLVQMVREAGAAEVHLRISSPPYRWPCFYGMDTGDRSTLLAADRTVDEIREYLGVDSLAYLGLNGLIEATGVHDGGLCTACLSGRYPTEVAGAGDKYVLERS